MAARGEHVVVFSARTGLEALLPVIVGATVGLALAVGATGLFAPAGTVDAATFRSGVARTALVALIALVLLAAAAGASFLRLLDTSSDSRRLLRYFPWELDRDRARRSTSSSTSAAAAAWRRAAPREPTHPTLDRVRVPAPARRGRDGDRRAACAGSGCGAGSGARAACRPRSSRRRGGSLPRAGSSSA